MGSRPRTARARRRQEQWQHAKRRRKEQARLTASDQPLTSGEIGDHPLSGLTSALLKAVWAFYGEDHNDFAYRSGVSPAALRAAEHGEPPAWALPDRDFAAIADGLAAGGMGELAGFFDLAAAFEMALTFLTNGVRCRQWADYVCGAALLAQRHEEGSWPVLNWALEPCPAPRVLHAAGHAIHLSAGPLAGPGELTRIRDAAEALAADTIRVSWVGGELLAICQTGRPLTVDPHV